MRNLRGCRGIRVEFGFVLLLTWRMTALRFFRELRQGMMVFSVLCAICVLSGLALSYPLDLPSGPVMVLFVGVVCLLSFGLLRR
jgi:ABC-type Mn2+/Zn2+ transport system permease subunit